MPLLFTISCCSKSRLVLPSWFNLSCAGSPGWSGTKSKRAIKQLVVCVCVCVCVCACMCAHVRACVRVCEMRLFLCFGKLMFTETKEQPHFIYTHETSVEQRDSQSFTGYLQVLIENLSFCSKLLLTFFCHRFYRPHFHDICYFLCHA